MRVRDCLNMLTTEVTSTTESEGLSQAELDDLEWDRFPDGWPLDYTEVFDDLSVPERARALEHLDIEDELNEMCVAAIDALPGSVKAEGPALKPTEYSLLLNLCFSRREHVLLRLEEELHDDPDSWPASPMKGKNLYEFPASIERLRSNITPTLEARQGTESLNLDRRAIAKAAKGLSDRGLIKVEMPAANSRGSYRWEIEIVAIRKLASLHGPCRLALSDCDIKQVAWLLHDWRIKTAQASVLIPVRVAALRQCLEDADSFAIEHSNAELEALTGVNRQTAQKILLDAPFAPGLGVESHEEVRRDGSKAIFRTEMTQVDLNESWPPSPRVKLRPLRL